MSERPHRVLACAENRGLLRHLAKFLAAFGFDTKQTATMQQTRIAIESWRPDILLLDDSLYRRGGVDLSCPGGWHMHSIMMIECPESEDVQVALESGIEDFLAKPLVHGELLARLRTAVRSLEYERRARQQRRFDPICRLASRSTFYETAKRETLAATRKSSTGGSGTDVSCVMFDLDHFKRIEARHGQDASEEALKAAAEFFVQESDSTVECLACFEKDQFAALMLCSEIEAAEWADQIRSRLRQSTFQFESLSFQFSASFGVAQFRPGRQSLEEFIDCGLAACEAAKESGRDCVMRSGQCENETQTWQELADPERLLANTSARDVMAPTTVSVRNSDLVSVAADLLRQTGAVAVPVVNRRGLLVGLVTHEGLQRYEETHDVRRSRLTVNDMMNPGPICEPESTTFAQLTTRLSDNPQEVVVITHEDRPTGLVTLASLSALSESISTYAFRDDRYSHGSEYLQVGEINW